MTGRRSPAQADRLPGPTCLEEGSAMGTRDGIARRGSRSGPEGPAGAWENSGLERFARMLVGGPVARA
jgi:hypothetical protein